MLGSAQLPGRKKKQMPRLGVWFGTVLLVHQRHSLRKHCLQILGRKDGNVQELHGNEKYLFAITRATALLALRKNFPFCRKFGLVLLLLDCL